MHIVISICVEKNQMVIKPLSKPTANLLECPFFLSRSQSKARTFNKQPETNAMAWFEKECRDHGCGRIATGHNSNDDLETVLHRIIKGTGINGLSGIPVKRGKIIRPIIWMSRSEIAEYAAANKVPYRSDSSNSDIKYDRNYLRHEIIPQV